MIENILAMYDLASPADVSEGRLWYQYAKAECQALADEFGVDLRRVVFAVAALSPMMQWEQNISAARKVLQGHSKIRGAFSSNVEKAWHIILDSKDWERWLSGRKVRSFAANILGETEPVTIDTWAWRIWAKSELRAKPPALDKIYDTIAADYKAAADRVGMSAQELQAITWVTIRRIANGGSGWGQLSLEM